jgi:hypothetical protein
MQQSPGAWIGIYAGTSNEPPTAYTAYDWYQYKGAQGETGEQGATGEAGTKGDTGDKGTKGDKGDKGDKGETGETGAAGEGFQIIGYYADMEALQAAVSDPQAGDAYGIGAAAPYDIYIYNGVDGALVNNGTIQGAKGDKGDKGDKGETGETGAAGETGAQGVSAYVHIRYAAAQPAQDSDMQQSPDAWIGIYAGTSVTAPTAYTAYAWYQYKGAQGETGEKGDTGETGETGERGETGEPGPGVAAGGSAGHVLKKKSGTDFDTEWGDIVALPSGGGIGDLLVKKTTEDGDAEWQTLEAAGVATKEELDALFTYASNGKSAVAGAIGDPATQIDTFAELAGYINANKETIASALSGKGVEAYQEDPLALLADKVSDFLSFSQTVYAALAVETARFFVSFVSISTPFPYWEDTVKAYDEAESTLAYIHGQSDFVSRQEQLGLASCASSKAVPSPYWEDFSTVGDDADSSIAAYDIASTGEHAKFLDIDASRIVPFPRWDDVAAISDALTVFKGSIVKADASEQTSLICGAMSDITVYDQPNDTMTAQDTAAASVHDIKIAASALESISVNESVIAEFEH